MGALPGLLLSFVTCLSDGAAPDEAGFVASFAALQKLGDAGKWSEEKAALKALLDETGDQPWVRSRRTELVEEMRRAAIRSAVPQPDPATLTDGKLTAWDRRTGEFSVTYAQGQWRDFVRAGDFYMHAASFDGPMTVRISGDEFRWSGGDLLHLLFGVHDDAIEVAIGARKDIANGIFFKPICELLHRTGSSQEILGNFERGPSFGATFDLDVAVTAREISVSGGVLRYGDAKLPPKFHGRFGISNLAAIKRLTLRGHATTAWIQERLDATTRDAERKFLATWRVDDELPAWLRGGETPPVGAAANSENRKVALPWPLTPDQAALFKTFASDLDEGRAEQAAARVRKLPPDALPRDLADYVLINAMARLGTLELEADRIEQFVARNPDFASGLYLHARLQCERFAFDDAARELAALHGRLAVPGQLAADRVQIELLRGRPEEAQQLLREARAEGVASPDFDELDRTVVHVLRGPEFAKRFEQASPHFTVVTDLDVAAARAALKVLEESYSICAKVFGESDAPPRPFPVYLFSGQAGYVDYVGKRSKLGHSSVGTYSPLFKHLMVWSQADRGETMRTLRHEATHQYLDLLGYHLPVWYEEGLAVYVALIASSSKNDLKGGTVDPAWLELLKRHRADLRPVADFIATAPDAFYAKGEANYAEAWALVHFLRHGMAGAGGGGVGDDPAPQEINARLMDAVRQRLTPQEVARRAFEGVDFARFDGRFLDHVAHLRAPPEKK